jgi:hypothetical protein
MKISQIPLKARRLADVLRYMPDKGTQQAATVEREPGDQVEHRKYEIEDG